MRHCRWLSCGKSTTLVGNVENGGGKAGGGGEAHGKSLHLLLNLAVKMKLL